MEVNLLNLRNSINKAFLKILPDRTGIEVFKKKIFLVYELYGLTEEEIRIVEGA
jgi:hypothetical protein